MPEATDITYKLDTTVCGARFVAFDGMIYDPGIIENKRKKYILKNLDNNRSAQFSSLKKIKTALSVLQNGEDTYDLLGPPLTLDVVGTKMQHPDSQTTTTGPVRRINMSVNEVIESIIPFNEQITELKNLALGAMKTIVVDSCPHEVPDNAVRFQALKHLNEFTKGKAPQQIVHTHIDERDPEEVRELTPEIRKFALRELAQGDEGLAMMKQLIEEATPAED